MLPAIVCQQRCACDEIGQRRGVGSRSLRALACEQIELGEPFAFLTCGEQGSAAVELTDDLENMFLDRVRRRVLREQATDAQMLRRSLAHWRKRVRRFLDAVMHEPIGPFQLHHQTGPHRRPQRCVQRFLALTTDQGQGADPRAVAQAGEKPEGVLRRRGQTPQLAEHEFHDVIGEALRPDTLELPRPVAPAMIEGE